MTDQLSTYEKRLLSDMKNKDLPAELLTQLNDYFMSKKTEPKPTEDTIGFGKYKGRTVDDIVLIDRPYVIWLKEKAGRYLNPKVKARVDELV